MSWWERDPRYGAEGWTLIWPSTGGSPYFVQQHPRKRRKAGRALRFADLKPGDVLVSKRKWRMDKYTRHETPVANDDHRTVRGQTVGFAICEHRWFDPVAGEDDPVAGEMVGIRSISCYGRDTSLTKHTLRGLASNGYHVATEGQSASIRAWLDQYQRIVAQWKAGEITEKAARAAYQPWGVMLRECGLAAEDAGPEWRAA